MTNQSNVVGRRSLRAILSTVIAVLFITLVFVNTAKADTFSQKTVTIIEGTRSYTITTNETEPIEILKDAGITLTKDDYTKPALDSVIKKDTRLYLYRVDYKTKVETKTIKYSTIKQNDSTLPKGTTKTVRKGVNGTKKITYQIKYVNGKAQGKSVLSETITKKPTSKIVKVGTKTVKGYKDTTPNGVKSKNGYSVGQKITGKYTHYCACATCNGNSNGITSSGKKIKNGMKNPYYVACNWLPLGSVIEVDGVNYIVVDRGGSGLSKKGRIDIFTPEGHSACYKYGTGKCSIKIVRLGW